MRVALLIDRWQPDRGGAETALDLFARHLAGRGHEVHVVAAEARSETPGPFHRVAAGGWTRSARERGLGRAMAAAAERAGCDVTVGVRHLERVDVLWCHGGGHAATLAGRWRATHGGADPPDPVPARGRHRAFLALERAALERGARRVVCPSRIVRDEIAAAYPAAAGRLRVVENGVDRERFHPRERPAARAALRPALGVGGEIPLLAFVGRNPVLKGLPQLYAALADLPGEWHLVVAGPKRPEAWIRRARRLGVDPRRVSVRAHVDPLLLAAGADLCVLPTWRDPCPLATLEALSAGTPVVTSRFAGTADAARKGGGEVVDDPADRDVLRAALGRSLERVRTGADPARARAAVEGRGLEPWLAGVEQVVVEAFEEGIAGHP